MNLDMTTINAIVPWATFVNLARLAMEQPADWPFVTLQLTLFALQVASLVMLWRRAAL